MLNGYMNNVVRSRLGPGISTIINLSDSVQAWGKLSKICLKLRTHDSKEMCYSSAFHVCAFMGISVENVLKLSRALGSAFSTLCKRGILCMPPEWSAALAPLYSHCF